MEGHIPYGIPTIAVAQQMISAERRDHPANWDGKPRCDCMRHRRARAAVTGLPSGVALLNVNIPSGSDRLNPVIERGSMDYYVFAKPATGTCHGQGTSR